MRKARLVLVAALAAVTVGLPAAAYADAWSGVDAAGDVHAFHYDPEPPPCGTSTDWNAPANTTNDITKLVVNHTLERVVLTLRLRDLRARGSNMTEFAIRTNERGYTLDVDRFDTGGKPETFLALEPKLSEPDECGGFSTITSDIPCARLVAEIAPDRDVVKVSIPRRCLSTPRWVQVGASNFRFEDEAGGTFRVYGDRWAPPGSDESGFLGPYGRRVLSG